jgi:hypothetical protein
LLSRTAAAGSPVMAKLSFNGLTFETLSKIEGGHLHIELLADGEIEGTVFLTGLNPENGQIISYTADFHGQYLATQ